MVYIVGLQTHPTSDEWGKLEGVYNSCPTPISLRSFGSDPKANPCGFDPKRTISNYVAVDDPNIYLNILSTINGQSCFKVQNGPKHLYKNLFVPTH